MILKIALLQMAAAGADQDSNLAKGTEFCRQAAARGADVALFPEMWNIGYTAFDPNDPGARAAWQAQAIPVEGAFVQHFQTLAAELRMAVAATFLEQGQGSPLNSVVLIDRSGRIVLTHAKVHLCDFNVPEVACAPGRDFSVVTLDTSVGPVEMGMMICMDREYPESARLLMLKGAEIVLTPNSCDLASCSHVGDVRLAQIRGRAFENTVGIAVANYPAPECDGHSIAVAAHGAVITEAGEDEGIWMAEFDLTELRALRSSEKHRNEYLRPECYAPLGPSFATKSP